MSEKDQIEIAGIMLGTAGAVLLLSILPEFVKVISGIILMLLGGAMIREAKKDVSSPSPNHEPIK